MERNLHDDLFRRVVLVFRAVALTGGRDGLLGPDAPGEKGFGGQEDEPDAVAEEGGRDGESGEDGVEVVMVGGRYDDRQDQERVEDAGAEEAKHLDWRAAAHHALAADSL